MLDWTLGRSKVLPRRDHSTDCISQGGNKKKALHFSIQASLKYRQMMRRKKKKLSEGLWNNKIQNLNVRTGKSKWVATNIRENYAEVWGLVWLHILTDTDLKFLSRQYILQEYSFLTMFLLASVFSEVRDNRKTVCLHVILTLAAKSWLEYWGLIPELT